MTIALVLTLASLQPARTATPMFLLDSNVNEPTPREPGRLGEGRSLSTEM